MNYRWNSGARLPAKGKLAVQKDTRLRSSEPGAQVKDATGQAAALRGLLSVTESNSAFVWVGCKGFFFHWKPACPLILTLMGVGRDKSTNTINSLLPLLKASTLILS